MSVLENRDDIERLRDNIEAAWNEALKFGLDPFPTHFELVPASIMYEFASYGVPGRFSHWTHGKAYHRQKMQYDLGLSKIYEMVINTNPSYAFLMDMNDLLQNTFVAAHVFGHTDFFKNNAYFQNTSRRMVDKAGIHAERIAQYEFDHGKAEVERFLDAALSVQEHVDYNLLLHTEAPKQEAKPVEVEGEFDDLWSLERKAKQAEEERERHMSKPPKFPEKPEKDILLFIARHAPYLKPWQRDIIEIVRTEMLYFVPQAQTKILNEGWACLVSNSLVMTEQGLISYDALHEVLAKGNSVRVGSGNGATDYVTDRHIRRNAATIRLRTRRGLILEGAEEHKLGIGSEQWLELKDVKVGQKIPLSVGDNLWPEQLVPITAPVRLTMSTLDDVINAAGIYVSSAMVQKVLNGQAVHGSERILQALQSTGYRLGRTGKPIYGKRSPLVAPTHMTESFAEFLGYLTGDGNIHTSKNAIGYTTGDRELADRYAQLILDLFAIEAKPFWDDRTANGKGGRWRVVFYSANVLDLLQSLGIDLKAKAAQKRIPDVILRSPKSVVSAFLRAYFDCDGCASAKEGLILSTFSNDIAQTLQILLLNYGILSRRYGANVRIKSVSAKVFAEEIGFNLPRKQELMRQYINKHRWFLKEKPFDEVVSIEHDVADVYDITVERSHRYVANGMLHHNSIWHSRIMRQLGEEGILSDADTIEFAHLHSSVLSPSRTSLNPYYLGFKMYEAIEKRWNEPTEEEQRELGRKPGMGLQKIFEIRELDNDVSFLRNYLTKDLVKDLDLYMFHKEGDEWVVSEKRWEAVRDGIVASLTNFGYPYLVVDDGDYRGNRELYIKHMFEGQELDLNYAEKTLQHVYTMWGRPVHLETVFEGKRVLLTFDGERNSKSSLEK